MEIQYEKLLKLADFIEDLPNKDLGSGPNIVPRAFSFDVIRYSRDCGTVGCAIGYTPDVFPDEITTNFLGDPFVRETGVSSISGIAGHLFGLLPEESCALFLPDEQDSINMDLPMLDEGATGKQVADNIRAFVEIRKQEEASR